MNEIKAIWITFAYFSSNIDNYGDYNIELAELLEDDTLAHAKLFLSE